MDTDMDPKSDPVNSYDGWSPKEVSTADPYERFGRVGDAVTRPLSSTYRVNGGRHLLKIYRKIDPYTRRDREADALALAERWCLPVPEVLERGVWGDESWLLVTTVPGSPCSVEDEHLVGSFVHRVLALGRIVHQPVAGGVAGMGWRDRTAGWDAGSHREFLLEQLSSRCHRMDWWSVLTDALSELATTTGTVYLHGDIKPEHLLVDSDRTFLVDWEDCARGPAAYDYTDAMFHLVRDLIYTGRRLSSQLVGEIGQLPVTGGLLAWRVVKWLDRRRPADILGLTSADIYGLACTDNPRHAVTRLANVIQRFESHDVPR